MPVAFALVRCLDHTLLGCFAAHRIAPRSVSEDVPWSFFCSLGVGVNELTNVTSNVNGWLPVQDGGTWRSDTDRYITNLI